MPTDHSAPMILTTAPNEMLASLLVGRLQNAGVHAQMVGGLTAGFRADAPGRVQILIPAAEEPFARSLLAEWNLPAH